MLELTVALKLSLRIIVAGFVWSRVAESQTEVGNGKAGAGHPSWCYWLTIGLGSNLLLAFALCLLGRWTPVVDWASWGAMVLVGLAINRRNLGRITRSTIGLWLVFIGGVWLIMMLPPRSEWLVGGWDPGVYMNTAAALARSGSWHPSLETVYAGLPPAALELFTGAEGTYREVFPGVPVDMQSGALLPYFFPLLPVCGAFFMRIGGLDLLCRMNLVLGLVSVFSVAGLASVLFGNRRAGYLAGGSLLVSSLWWYHIAVPTTEILQLVLFCALIPELVLALRRDRSVPVASGLLLLCLVLNRFSFVAFAGILLVVVIVGDREHRGAPSQQRLALWIGAILAGIALDLLAAWVTVARVNVKDHALLVVLGPFVLTAAAALYLAATSWWRGPILERWGNRILRGVLIGGGMLLLAALVLASSGKLHESCFAALDHAPWLAGSVARLDRLVTFQQAAYVFVMGLGLVLLGTGRQGPGPVGLFCLFCLGVLSTLMLNPGVAGIYPWALRRYLVFWVPLASVAVVYAVQILISGCNTRVRVVVGVVAGVAVMASAVHGARAAARVGDYRGVKEALDAIVAACADDDIVVADDARWGTPLLLLYGIDAIDGSRLWSARTPHVRAAWLDALEALRTETGRRVVWLTSVPEGLGIYEGSVASAASPLLEHAFTYRTVIHSGRADHFACRDHQRTFRLFTAVTRD